MKVPKGNYMPSNGTEGCGFIESFCGRCLHERWLHYPEEDRDEDKCRIFTDSMIKDYVPEWIYDNGEPRCTEFVPFDWDNEDPEGDPPKKPILPDPRQIDLFPLYPSEKEFDETLVKEIKK